jgi:hypothetical protein
MPVVWKGDQFQKAINLATDMMLATVAANMVRDAVFNLKKNGSWATGHLTRAVGMSRLKEVRGTRVVEVGFKTGVQQGKHYGMAVERGRSPGKRPPIDAILPWVLVKHLDAIGQKVATNKAGHAWVYAKGRASRASREKIARGIAFVIARAIGLRGIRPKPYLRPAYDKHVPTMHPIFIAMLQKQFDALGVGVH